MTAADGGMPARDARPAKRVAADRWATRISLGILRAVCFLSAHWLALANAFLGLYALLPVFSPILFRLGYARGGALVQILYRPFCHQRPERSFFLFGDRLTYSAGELASRLGLDTVPYRYVGAPGIGYKVAMCQRDVAIYGTMFLAGLLYALARSRLRPLSGRAFLLLILPMLVDGLGQLFGFWTSTWVSRIVTGALFGLAAIWLAYPYVASGMDQVHQQLLASLAATEEAHGSESG